MANSLLKSGLAFGIIATTCAISSSVQAATFEKMYVFGDSLSDTGNVFAETKFLNSLFPDTIPVIPPSPFYFNGRFSNGPVWVEYLAEDLQVQPTSFFNFAYGGATTGTDNTIIPFLPGLKTQVNSFASQNIPVLNNDLFIVLAGANDYLPTQSPTFTPYTTAKESVKNITQTVDQLSQKGAKNILVVNLPDLGKLPLTLGTPNSEHLSKLTVSHNKALAKGLGKLQKKLSPDTKLYTLDLYSQFNQWLSNPAQFGFSNVNTPCLLVACPTPNEYIFWDQIHPTAKAHQLIGELAYKTLQKEPEIYSVPESSTGLGVLALGLVGLSVRGISRLKKGKESGQKAA